MSFSHRPKPERTLAGTSRQPKMMMKKRWKQDGGGYRSRIYWGMYFRIYDAEGEMMMKENRSRTDVDIDEEYFLECIIECTMQQEDEYEGQGKAERMY